MRGPPPTLLENLMFRLLPVAALAFLAACDPAMMPPLPGTEPAVPEPPQLPPAVAAVMPPGTPPSTVFVEQSTGCYLFSVELTDPPLGYYVRDGAGNPICEGDAPPLVAEAPDTEATG